MEKISESPNFSPNIRKSEDKLRPGDKGTQIAHHNHSLLKYTTGVVER